MNRSLTIVNNVSQVFHNKINRHNRDDNIPSQKISKIGERFSKQVSLDFGGADRPSLQKRDSIVS